MFLIKIIIFLSTLFVSNVVTKICRSVMLLMYAKVVKFLAQNFLAFTVRDRKCNAIKLKVHCFFFYRQI